MPDFPNFSGHRNFPPSCNSLDVFILFSNENSSCCLIFGKKNMNRLVQSLAFLLVLATFSSGAQNITQMNLDDFLKQFNTYEHGRKIGGVTDVAGTPYENEEFIIGAVLTKSKIRYVEVPLRFNIYSDEMEFDTRGRGIFTVGVPELVDTLYIGTDKYIYGHFMAGKKELSGYFRVLKDGTSALVQKMVVSLKNAEPRQPYKEFVPPRFERLRDEFYLVRPFREWVRIHDKRDILPLWETHSSELEKFIRDNKIRFTVADDLVQLVNYAGSLQEE